MVDSQLAGAAPRVVLASGARRAVLDLAVPGRDVLVVDAPPRALGRAGAELLDSAPGDVFVARRSYAAGPIVVGYDLSDEARAAVHLSIGLARQSGARVVAVHSLVEAAPDAAPLALAQRAAAACRAIAASMGADVGVRVVTGSMELALLAAERELGARLLVVGAPRATVRSSLAARVATAATGPVLVVRGAGARSDGAAPRLSA